MLLFRLLRSNARIDTFLRGLRSVCLRLTEPSIQYKGQHSCNEAGDPNSSGTPESERDAAPLIEHRRQSEIRDGSQSQGAVENADQQSPIFTEVRAKDRQGQHVRGLIGDAEDEARQEEGAIARKLPSEAKNDVADNC
eukprot:CAMPEP_0206546312 /NCGR_PEP_ID=MMETSP0325_2-20121206/12634_1 /ASSEMBLY_ACC=CAM_ASM_000347 /TAXON_ID=2866 /ORGANISM="Crypthecodinium cohnii, Strain Seligo" /LENGTH=137 /DNA_ID=CAMNT_0054045419 /DNA_START=644 /DNA_END=1057 /DNA_ORIENTATION=+